MLTKKLYEQATGRSQKSNVIAYQIRQSFRPGEITAEEANRIGYELASRFLKGKHAFIVATHTDREHISLLTLRGSDTSACKTVGHRTSIFKNNETARIGGCRPYACKIRHLADFQCDLQESKKKSTILPTKYSAFLVENSGIEPLTSCMPCKRSPS